MERPSKKQKCKLLAKKCQICGDKEYTVLDVHRLVPGSEGGTYNEHNMICLCCKCHRKAHSGLIHIIGKYFSTAGYVVHYFEGGKEYISPC